MFCSKEDKPHFGPMSHHCHGNKPSPSWRSHHHHGHHHHDHHHHQNHFNGFLWMGATEHSRHHGHCHSHQHFYSRPKCFFRGMSTKQPVQEYKQMFDYSENYN